MSVATLDEPMAKRAKTEKTETVAMKIPVDVADNAKMVAVFRKTTPGELIGDLVRELLKRMRADEIAKEAAKGKPSK